MNFFPPFNSVSWWRAAFEWSSVLCSRRISFKENGGYWIVPVHPGLTKHAELHKQWLREHHNHWWWVLGVRVLPGTRHFPYNENPKRAQNTASVKCWLPSTDAIDKRVIFTHGYGRSRSPHANALHWYASGFRKRSDSFLTDLLLCKLKAAGGQISTRVLLFYIF